MRQYIVLIGTLLNGSLISFEWNHVSGMCDTKMDSSKTLTLAHLENIQIDLIEKMRTQKIDIITFDLVSDDLYDELKGDYAHFYIDTGNSGTSCIASKYALNPSLSIKDGDGDYSLEEGSSFEVILAAAKDTKSDKDDDKKITTRKWEITGEGDSEGNITIKGQIQYKQEDPNGSTEISISGAVSRDEEGKTEAKGKISIGGSF